MEKVDVKYGNCIITKNQWNDTVQVQVGKNGGAIHSFNTLKEAMQFVYRVNYESGE